MASKLPMMSRPAGPWLAVFVVLAIFSAAPSGAADDIGDIEKALPRSYAGEFRWLGDSVAQKVTIKINVVNRLGADRIEAIGCGQYDMLGRLTDIGVRMVVEVPSLDVEIWEFSPFGPIARAFVTDGSHRGKILDNLQTINAEWTTLSTGRKGRLQLQAGKVETEFRCSGEQAMTVRPRVAF